MSRSRFSAFALAIAFLTAAPACGRAGARHSSAQHSAAQASLEAPRFSQERPIQLSLFNLERSELDPRFGLFPQRIHRAELLPHLAVQAEVSERVKSLRFYLDGRDLGLVTESPFRSPELDLTHVTPDGRATHRVEAVSYETVDGKGPPLDDAVWELEVDGLLAPLALGSEHRVQHYWVTDTGQYVQRSEAGDFMALDGELVLSKEDVSLQEQGEEQAFFVTQREGATRLVFAFQLLIPADAAPDTSYPLLVHLHHGWHIFRGTDNDGEPLSKEPLFSGPYSLLRGEGAARFPAVVLVPQLPRVENHDNVTWEWGAFSELSNETGSLRLAERASPSGAQVVRIIDDLLAHKLPLGDVDSSQHLGGIDAARIYLTGHSMGSVGGWDLLMRRPGLWAGAVLMAGYADHERAGVVAHIPIWAFHHRQDAYNPFIGTQTMYEKVSSAPHSRHEMKMTALEFDTKGAGDQAHFQTPDAVWSRDRDVLGWLFSQVRAEAASGSATH